MELPPPCLPWFGDINRYLDRQRQRFVAKILPGEYYVTNQGEMIGTVLGSCVAACIRDPASGIGGMNHFMLPARAADKIEVLSDAYRYGNYAMEHLINDIMKLCGSRRNLEFKVFGGANVIAGMSNVGDRNVSFVLDYLKTEGFAVKAQDLGGDYPRKVLFDPRDGKVMMRRIRSLHNDTVVQREAHYMDEISHEKVEGEIDLFDDDSGAVAS